ncbi:class I fructose-bisphosphate aldolase [Pseudoxanthomonas winnipegensis]|uniref:Fructose-bisphosphate aldolase n=1 Tax=Pseudoxanthomonas winnipegensis TaxID=2480810 RepID=A0A4Q8LI00_9GAMM|nr:class I fructose-bisphosphate aldolase [Pseudoxanthomonas winnipegensis]RZZ84494.1 fructose-bisphosphate aldolase class I [Pseudoxanthomonas winnipegensis]RZZ85827.1 fructose-bisphosphate aldolase class I [Pseudoxanthomonas winnipegensis]TAA29150.1 fructose-bisphosphate aldolase class I [Pseudoxanthomonas winnipegensis]TAA36016.1 fructose-bisphosphate aldolase class I [Pseudoxanthomonas winnipegensis]TBV72069.1 fructose-bisphosphate aldolase class I [Pseudoxanthomonas winnipegensis]
MSIESLAETAQALVAPGKGIIAIDESTATIGKRFAAVGIENTEAHRRRYRELLLTTPRLSDHISGAILFEETLRQSTEDGTPFPKYMASHGLIPGIKVDKGTSPLAGCPGELVTEGLDGMRDRLKAYYALGARFAKWRAVITIGEDIPSGTCIEANAHALARYAALCQEQGLVAIVEPEVLMDGDHDIQVCYEVTEAMLRSLFGALHDQGVLLEGTLLKASMVVPGQDCEERADIEEVAESTVMCLKSTVPAILPGIVFLSGGQSDADATAHLDAMNRLGNLPWPLSFSYGRAMQQAALAHWAKDPVGNFAKAQAIVLERAKENGLAALGKWKG